MAERKHWTESFRIATPLLLLTISLFLGYLITDMTNFKRDLTDKISTMTDSLKQIDNKMFIHLTNSEIHIPRATVVSADEFKIYQCMRDAQMKDLKDGLVEIKKLLMEHMDKHGK